MSISEILLYFFKHYSELNGQAALIILSVVFLPMMLIPLAGLLNYTWVSTIGVEKSYIYLGSDDKDGYYVDLNNKNSSPIAGPYLGEDLSFDDVYWAVDVYYNPGDPNFIGELKSQGKGLSLMSLVSFSITGLLIVFTALTYYARLIYEHKHAESLPPNALSPFDAAFKRRHAFSFVDCTLVYILRPNIGPQTFFKYPIQQISPGHYPRKHNSSNPLSSRGCL